MNLPCDRGWTSLKKCTVVRPSLTLRPWRAVHACRLAQYHVGRCRCECGAKTHARKEAA